MNLAGVTRGIPLGRSIEEAEQYVSDELERAVPKGWRVERFPGSRLTWRLYRDDADWDYRVLVPPSLDYVIFTHGNSDAGALRLTHFLLQALVIDAPALREFGMTACLQHLLSRCRTNQWGLS